MRAEVNKRCWSMTTAIPTDESADSDAWIEAIQH
jgi:hypothetical protein